MKVIKLNNCVSSPDTQQGSEEGQLLWIDLAVIYYSLVIEAAAKVLNTLLIRDLGQNYEEPAIRALMSRAIEASNERLLPRNVDAGMFRLSVLAPYAENLLAEIQNRAGEEYFFYWISAHIAAFVAFHLRDLARNLRFHDVVEAINNTISTGVSYSQENGWLVTLVVGRGSTTFMQWGSSTVQGDALFLSAAQASTWPDLVGSSWSRFDNFELSSQHGAGAASIQTQDFGALRRIYSELLRSEQSPAVLTRWWAQYPQMDPIVPRTAPSTLLPGQIPSIAPTPPNPNLASLAIALGAALASGIGLVSWRLIRNRFIEKPKASITVVNVGGPMLVAGLVVYLASRLILSLLGSRTT